MHVPEFLAGAARFPEYVAEHRELFDQLAQDQNPQVLFITCSDSRIDPDLITSSQPGDLFVARTIANVVPPFGSGAIGVGAAIEYAVLHLNVEHLVVCGHTDCGGIHALGTHIDLSREPHLARWIDYARPAKTKVDASGLPQDARHLSMVRENVLLQLENLRSYDPVRHGERNGTLVLHGWVYYVDTGQVEMYDPVQDTWSLLTLDGD
ncbi:MAG: carbonic anhydrase [Anaerolineae bacterium]|jgi:carbonic anhydrase